MADYDDSGVGNFVPATPMTNADFRKMLETPRPRVSGSSATPRHQSRPKPVPEQKQRKPAPTKSAKIPPPESQDQEDGPKYRDRAKERREGRAADYEDVDQELAHMLHDKGLADVSKLTVQQSQYLGGDIRRTHWVKGLDYALLAKERERVDREQAEAAKKAAKKEVRIRKEDMQIHSSLARGVFDALFNPPRPDIKELYLPRRTAFVYEMDPDEPWAYDEVPTTLHRSKADCPQVQDMMMASVDNSALQRIGQLLAHIKFAPGGKKLKKKEREELLYGPGGKGGADKGKGSMPPPPPRLPKKAAQGDDDDEGDIFGDAGSDYKPAPPPDRKAAGRKKDSYFDQKDDMSDIPLPGSARGRGAQTQQDMEDGEVVPPPPPPPPPSYPPPGQGYGNDQYHQQDYGYGGYQQQGGYTDPQAYAAYQNSSAAQQGQYWQQQGGDDKAQASGLQQGGDNGQEEEQRWRVKATVKDVEQYATEVPDDYAECYPNYFTTSNYAEEIVGSDDEGDREHMDSKANLKSRADFATDEEWQQYKATREAAPKAAFQFGVKVADGRKTHKDLDKKKDHKLDNQLNKIERMLKDKGHDHTQAFKTPSIDASLDMPTPRAKRQRI